MISLILIKLGHTYWVKLKLKKILAKREAHMSRNKKAKRISLYGNFKRKRNILKKKKFQKKLSFYAKFKKNRN